MNLLTLTTQNTQLIYSKNIDGIKLEVRDLKHYRWFNFGGDMVQSLMDIKNPQQVVMPVYQSMLLCLLWKKAPLSVLNLGMGGATFERFFNEDSTITLTSVDKSSHVISMAKTYFNLPKNANTHCQSAENYLQNNSISFDLILCDIFSYQQNTDCVNQNSFYQKLSDCLISGGVVSINLDPENEKNLLKILHLTRKYFSNIAFVEFKDYKNIVLILSSSQIPEKEFLTKQNKQEMNTIGIDFTEFISSIHYLPNNKYINTP